MQRVIEGISVDGRNPSLEEASLRRQAFTLGGWSCGDPVIQQATVLVQVQLAYQPPFRKYTGIILFFGGPNLEGFVVALSLKISTCFFNEKFHEIFIEKFQRKN